MDKLLRFTIHSPDGEGMAMECRKCGAFFPFHTADLVKLVEVAERHQATHESLRKRLKLGK